MLTMYYKLAGRCDMLLQCYPFSLDRVYGWTHGKICLLYSVASQVILETSHSHA